MKGNDLNVPVLWSKQKHPYGRKAICLESQQFFQTTRFPHIRFAQKHILELDSKNQYKQVSDRDRLKCAMNGKKNAVHEIYLARVSRNFTNNLERNKK